MYKISLFDLEFLQDELLLICCKTLKKDIRSKENKQIIRIVLEALFNDEVVIK